jgi:YHS domain-containing protein
MISGKHIQLLNQEIDNGDINPEKNMTVDASTSEAKDPICGMTVDEATALHAERDGKTFYFCSEHCRDKFLSMPAGVKPEEKPGGCCG